MKRVLFLMSAFLIVGQSSAFAEKLLDCDYISSTNGKEPGTLKWEILLKKSALCHGDTSMKRSCGQIYSNQNEASDEQSWCIGKYATCNFVWKDDYYFYFDEWFLGKRFNMGTLDRMSGRLTITSFASQDGSVQTSYQCSLKTEKKLF